MVPMSALMYRSAVGMDKDIAKRLLHEAGILLCLHYFKQAAMAK